MGFRAKWVKWIRWCISSARFLVLINGTLISFFQRFKGLKQGDPLSSFLFIMAMKAFSSILKTTMKGGFIQGFLASGRKVGMVMFPIFFLLMILWFFVTQTRRFGVFELGVHVVWVFEAISDLKINLDKSKLIPIREVSNTEDLARMVEYQVDSLPSTYLGLPLRASFKSIQMWDAMEERFQKQLVFVEEAILIKMREIDFSKKHFI